MRKISVFTLLVMVAASNFIFAESGKVAICYVGSQTCISSIGTGNDLGNSRTNSYNIINDHGEEIARVPFPYQVETGFHEGFATVVIERFLVETLDGRNLLPNSALPVFVDMSEDGAGFAQYNVNEFAVVSENGTTPPVSISPSYITSFKNGYALFETRSRVFDRDDAKTHFGVLRKNGSYSIFSLDFELSLSEISSFHEGLFRVKGFNKFTEERRTYYFTENGRRVLGPFEDGGVLSNGLIPICENGSWRYIDASGKTVLSAPQGCEEAGEFTKDFAPVKLNGKYGFIDKTGKLRIPARFEDVETLNEELDTFPCCDTHESPFVDSLRTSFVHAITPVMLDGKWGLVNSDGDFVLSPQFSNISTTANGFVTQLEGEYGFINATGKEILAPEFAQINASDASTILAFVDDSECCFYSLAGVKLFDRTFKQAGPFCNGLALVNGREVINKSGEIVRTLPRNAEQFGMFLVCSTIVSNVMDTTGNVRTDWRYSVEGSYSEGLIIARDLNDENHSYVFLNTNGEVAIKGPFTSASRFQNGYATVSYRVEPPIENPHANEQWAIIDKSGHIVFEQKGMVLGEFSDSFAAFTDYTAEPKTCGFVDVTGKRYLNLKPVEGAGEDMPKVHPMSEGRAWIEIERNRFSLYSKESHIKTIDLRSTTTFHEGISYVDLMDAGFAYVDKNGELCIPPAFNPLPGNSNNRVLFQVRTTGKYGYCDYSGKMVIAPIYINATSFSQGLAAVFQDDGIQRVINPDGKVGVENVPWFIHKPFGR